MAVSFDAGGAKRSERFFLERIDDLKRESQSHWDLSNDIYIYDHGELGFLELLGYWKWMIYHTYEAMKNNYVSSNDKWELDQSHMLHVFGILVG